MFRSLDHPQGATLFLAKFTSKTFIKFFYINRVLWQRVLLCKITLLGMRLAMVYVVCYVHLDTTYMSPRNTRPTPVMGKLFKEGAKGKEKNFRRANIIY